MKKIIFVISIIALICAGPVFAGTDVSNAEGSIDLDDTSGGGPGVTGIAVSAASYVGYSAQSTAGGYTASTSGQSMAVQAYSTKANPDTQLMFGVRSSMIPGDTDDNRVYQQAAVTANAGAVFDSSDIVLTGSSNVYSGWLVRGGS